ncbi:MAG: hypothetical protein J5I65_05400 [Aridibacter famidurans]|nr:hypothetical protein [Aridibacter famidurans]
MRPFALLILVCLSNPFAATVSHAQEDDMVVISVCDLDVPKSIKQGNATFSELFSFNVGEDGKPTDVKAVIRNFVVEDSVKECLSDWTLPPSASKSRYVVKFRWVHGYGWRSIIIVSKGFKQAIRIKPGIGY